MRRKTKLLSPARHSSNKTQGHHSNGRRHNNNGRGNTNQRGGRTHEGKTRQQAVQSRDKYLSMARDALSSGNRFEAENYFQHAEHYVRIANYFEDQDRQAEAVNQFDDALHEQYWEGDKDPNKEPNKDSNRDSSRETAKDKPAEPKTNDEQAGKEPRPQRRDPNPYARRTPNEDAGSERPRRGRPPGSNRQPTRNQPEGNDDNGMILGLPPKANADSPSVKTENTDNAEKPDAEEKPVRRRGRPPKTASQ